MAGNINLEADFVVHPMKMGLFYTGDIKINYQKFRFVFDCGSTSSTTRKCIVDEYRNKIGDSKTIDLLVISHFDKDHVNYISKLIDGIVIKNVVLPFYTIDELEILILQSNDSDYLCFINDPIRYIIKKSNLEQNKETKFYIIHGSLSSEDVTNEESNDNHEEVTENDFIFNIPNSQKVTSYPFIGNSENSNVSQDISNIYQVSHDELGQVNFKGKVLLQFVFFNKQISKSETKLFYENVCKKLCKKFNRQTIKEVIIENSSKLKSATEIKKIYELVNKELSDNIKNEYLKNLNHTALSMAHIFSKEVFASVNKYEIINDDKILYEGQFETCDLKNKLSNTLLTSDMFLIKDTDNFYAKYNSYIDRIQIVQVPHHGSKNNSDISFYKKFKKKIFFVNCNSELYPDQGIKTLIENEKKIIVDNKYLITKIIISDNFTELNFNYIASL